MGQGLKSSRAEKNPYVMALANLPAQNTRRWTLSLKIFVVRAVEFGLLSFDQASERYSLSLEEFVGWRNLDANFRKSADRSVVRRALSANPLWIGPDRDSSHRSNGASVSRSRAVRRQSVGQRQKMSKTEQTSPAH